MKVLSLFSGIGGADIALEALGCETVAHSDIDDYANAVFAKRFPGSTHLGNVQAVKASTGDYDIIVGGFPCQDISNAGRRAGIEGERSGLWGEYARLIGEVQPRLVLIENVSALLRRGIDRVLWDLHEFGYACEWDCIPAAAVGAAHLRDRIWMVAYPDDLSVQTVFKGRRPKPLCAITHPPSKWPRAGKLEQGIVFACDPMAKRQTKRIDGRTYWNGVNLGDTEAQGLVPTPVARDWKGSGRPGQLGTTAAQGLWPTPKASAANYGLPRDQDWGDLQAASRPAEALLPTPLASSYGSNRGGAAGRVGPARHSLDSMARHGLWPTPTRSDGAGGPGTSGRSGGLNLRTAVSLEVKGRLNPDWVEWLMGFPVGWTDLTCDDPTFCTWDGEPSWVPRVAEGVEKRKQRLTCCGNALVPKVMYWVAQRALAAVFNKEVQEA